jgi:hypothetical protein
MPESRRYGYLHKVPFPVANEPCFSQFIKKIKAEKGYEKIGAVG